MRRVYSRRFSQQFLLLGLPLAINLFGADHVASISMLLPFVIMEFNFLAVVILTLFQEPEQGGKRQKLRVGRVLLDVAQNPLIIASFIGMLFSVFQIPLPLFLSRAVGISAKSQRRLRSCYWAASLIGSA